MNKDDFSIRLEEKNDYSAVESLVRESFWNVYRPGCSEHYVIHVALSDGVLCDELSDKLLNSLNKGTENRPLSPRRGMVKAYETRESTQNNGTEA